jgi:hypothetical protein
MSIPKMRGLSEAITEIHLQDPNSCLTLHALRRMVATGEIKCTKCGRRILINMDVLFEHLFYNDMQKQSDEISPGRHIQPIPRLVNRT